MQAAACLLFLYGDYRLFQHVPCIQAHVHHHGGDACLPFAVYDTPLNGCSAPVLRKQGRVDVDAAVLWKLQHCFRKKLAKGYDHVYIRLQSLKDLHKGGFPHLRRLIHRNAVFHGLYFHRCHLDFLTPAPGLIGLGDHCNYLMTGFHQRLKRRHGEIRCSHKYNAHKLHSYSVISSSSAAVSTSSPSASSTYIWPSRWAHS